MLERRSFERRPLQLNANYKFNNIEYPCTIVDISLQGMGLRVKAALAVGDILEVLIEKQIIPAKIVRVDGNIVGIKYDLLTDEQLEYIINLKNFEGLE
jgi:hypothetical protein